VKKKLMHFAMYCARARMHEMKRLKLVQVGVTMHEMKRLKLVQAGVTMHEMKRLELVQVGARMHEMKRLEIVQVGARMHEMKRLEIVHSTGVVQMIPEEMVIPEHREEYDSTVINLKMKKVETSGGKLDVVGVNVDLGLRKLSFCPTTTMKWQLTRLIVLNAVKVNGYCKNTVE